MDSRIRILLSHLDSAIKRIHALTTSSFVHPFYSNVLCVSNSIHLCTFSAFFPHNTHASKWKPEKEYLTYLANNKVYKYICIVISCNAVIKCRSVPHTQHNPINSREVRKKQKKQRKGDWHTFAWKIFKPIFSSFTFIGLNWLHMEQIFEAAWRGIERERRRERKMDFNLNIWNGVKTLFWHNGKI